MFIVSLHRNLKKERNNYEHAANTPHYEHATVTLPSRYNHATIMSAMVFLSVGLGSPPAFLFLKHKGSIFS